MFTVATRVDHRWFVGTGDTLLTAIAALTGKIVGAGKSPTHILNIEVAHPDNPKMKVWVQSGDEILALGDAHRAGDHAVAFEPRCPLCPHEGDTVTDAEVAHPGNPQTLRPEGKV